VAADSPVGVLGVQRGAGLSHEERRALGTAAAFVAIAVRNMGLFQATRDTSVRDSLTGCFRRGHALEVLDRELRRVRRSGRPLSILMFDIDHFKQVNDKFGHLRGDELLQRVGAQLTRVLRATDVPCRYGGDEFLVILPETPLLGAQQVAETLRREVAALSGDSDMSAGTPITISVGVAAAVPGELDVVAVIERADTALYRAKRQGRNCFCIVGERETERDTRTTQAPEPRSPGALGARG
jgi:diguanylate cyclase (GGDEF)-like protein